MRVLVFLTLSVSAFGQTVTQVDYNTQVKNRPIISDAGAATFAVACARGASGATVSVTKAWLAVPTQSCSANLAFNGGSIQPASAAVVTLTGAVTAAAVKIFDYSAGGTVVSTGAKIANVFPEWWDTSTATLTTAALNAAFLSRQHVVLSASTYTLNGPVTLRNGVTISGVNGKRVVVTLSGSTAGFVTGADVQHVTVSGFTIDCNNSAQIGFRWAGQQAGGALDATELDMHDMAIGNCTTAAYSGYHSYSVILTNNWFHNSAINLKLEDGYNNTYQVVGGTISGASGATAVYLGTGTSVFVWSAVVCQSNAGTCIRVANSSSGNSEMTFISPYFENNCLSLSGYDFTVDFTSYQSPVRGLKLIQPHFNNGNCTTAALIESTSDLTIEAPQGFTIGTNATIVVGRGVLRPVLFSGAIITYRNHAGGSIVPTNGRNFAENLLRSSVAMDTSIVSDPYQWAPTNGTISQDATLGPNGGLTWKLTYSGANSVNPASIFQPSNTLTPAGSLAGCGVWARTDAGTSLAWATPTGTNVYAGAVVNAQRVVIGTDWTWLWNSAGTDVADLAPLGCSFVSYPLSGSAAMYFQNPQMWRDTAATPLYIPTTTGIFNRANSPLGHTVFSQLGDAAIAQPVICDNCTIANPTLTGGAGALAVPIGAVWVGK